MLRWIKMADNAPSGRDVNLTEDVAHRSVTGHTLILIPGSTYEVTEDEWALLIRDHSDLMPHIQVLREPT